MPKPPKNLKRSSRNCKTYEGNVAHWQQDHADAVNESEHFLQGTIEVFQSSRFDLMTLPEESEGISAILQKVISYETQAIVKRLEVETSATKPRQKTRLSSKFWQMTFTVFS